MFALVAGVGDTLRHAGDGRPLVVSAPGESGDATTRNSFRCSARDLTSGSSMGPDTRILSAIRDLASLVALPQPLLGFLMPFFASLYPRNQAHRAGWFWTSRP